MIACPYGKEEKVHYLKDEDYRLVIKNWIMFLEKKRRWKSAFKDLAKVHTKNKVYLMLNHPSSNLDRVPQIHLTWNTSGEISSLMPSLFDFLSFIYKK